MATCALAHWPTPPEIHMTRRGCILLVTLLGSATIPATAAELEEQSVRQMIVSVDAAVRARDLAVLRDALADDITIMATTTFNGQVTRRSLSKTEYLEMLRKVWAMATDYSYRRSHEQITLRAAQATVISDVWESLTAGGQVMVTRSRETMTIESVNGRLQATAVSIVSTD
jgi:hypothetical protein